MKIGVDEVLNQLMEEAAEVIQAANKLHRARTGINPTPILIEDAQTSLEEEIADLMVCCKVLGLNIIPDIQEEKAQRWVHRINEKET